MGDRACAWSERTDISARSVLVTILGDTVAPLGGTVWLTDLIALAAPFGFNDRLVRTSMFRLVGERWVVNERVGRRSRYSLTPFGREEFAEADARIYRSHTPAWDGLWTLVFLDAGADPDSELVRHLRWRGFAELTRNVYAAPNGDVAGTGQLVDRLRHDPRPLVAAARFDELGPLANGGPFRETSGLAAAEASYRDLVDRYRWTTSAALDRLSGKDAFLLRTMLVHDLRRARLRDPDLPSDLLPAQWIGDEARDLAGSAYRAVTSASWRFVESVTGLTVDPTDPQLARRFVGTARPVAASAS